MKHFCKTCVDRQAFTNWVSGHPVFGVEMCVQQGWTGDWLTRSCADTSGTVICQRCLFFF